MIHKNKKGWSETVTIITMAIAVIIFIVIVLIISFSIEPHFEIYKNESGELVKVNKILNISKQDLTIEWVWENCEDITFGGDIETFRYEDYIIETWNQMK